MRSETQHAKMQNRVAIQRRLLRRGAQQRLLQVLEFAAFEIRRHVPEVRWIHPQRQSVARAPRLYNKYTPTRITR